MVKSSVFSVDIPGVTLEEIMLFFTTPDRFVDYHRESNGNDHVRVGRWKPSPASVAAVEASAAALAEAAAEAKGGKKKSKSASPPPAAAAAAPQESGYSHPACEPLSRDVAFLVSFRAPAWFKKAVGTETVKVRDCHDLVARVDRSASSSSLSESESEGASTSTSSSNDATASTIPKLETIIMRSQPMLWLPTAGTELKIAEITFDVAVKPEDDEEETDDEGEFSRGVRPANEKASTSQQQQQQRKTKPVANNKEKPTLVMRATVVACCDSMKWLVGLKSTVERIMLYQCEVMASSFIEWVSRRAREEYDGVEPTNPRPPAGPLPPISLPAPLRSLRNRQLSLPGEPSWDGGVHCGGAAGPIGGKAAVAAAAGGESKANSRRSSRAGGAAAGGTRSAASSRPTSAASAVFYDAMDSVPSSPLAVPTPETVAAAQLLGTQLSLNSSGAKHARDEAEAILREEAAKAAASAAKASAPSKISTSTSSHGPSNLGPKTRQGGGPSLSAAHVAKLQGIDASAASASSTERGHASKKGRRAAGAGVPSKSSSGSKLVRSFKKMWTTSGSEQQQQEQEQQLAAAAGSVEGQ